MEVCGEKQKKDNETTLNHANASSEDSGRGNEPKRSLIRVSRNDRPGEYERDSEGAEEHLG
jgi:hypothetical protein